MPVQRVPRYTLLFQDFLKHTPEKHADYKGIKQTLDAVRDVANRINEGIREQERRNAIIDIQNYFSPPLQLVESHRKFIKSGTLWKVCRKERKKRFFILFNDLFLHCKRQSETSFTLSQSMLLNDTIFEESITHEPLGFAIRHTKKSFIMIAADQSDRDEWVQVFKKTFEKLPDYKIRDLSDFAPIWKPDHSSQSCGVCLKPFSMTNRKHHCRRCGEIVCGNCSTNRIQMKDEPVRACNKCYDQVNSMRES